MLKISIPDGCTLYDARHQKYIKLQRKTYKLEHSLIAISRWETRYEKPLLETLGVSDTYAERIYYIRCMSVQPMSTATAQYIADKNGNEVYGYIARRFTATTINVRSPQKRNRSKQIVTSELIYAWMTIRRIPFSTEKWPLNRLLTLIDVIGVLESDDKMSSDETAQYYRKLNRQRHAG